MKSFILSLSIIALFVQTALAGVIAKTPNGVSVSKATLALASTSADAASATIEVASPQTITTTVTIPAGQRIRFTGNGKLIYSGAGNVIFTSGCIDELTPQMFGAVPDFNPATGAGTNSAAAFQNMFTAARQMPGIRVVIPPGKYLLTNSNARGTAVELGDPTHAATNVLISGYGAELFVGQSSRLLGLYNCTNVTVEGLKIWGYTGGSLGAGRANDHGIVTGYNSKQITLKNLTIVNCLGDCIYLGGSMTDGTATGLTTENATITGCTLKQRIGDGTTSDSGGTKSRWAISLVDVKGANIHDNIIYGGVDIEPNVAGQTDANISVANNQFRKGPVTPQAVVGTAYWYDEPYNAAGTKIDGFVTFTGPGSTTYNNTCKNNSFEYGYIQSYNNGFDEITGNVFQAGSIYVAAAINGIVKANIFHDKVDPAGNIIFYGTVARNVFTSNINTNAANSLFGLLAGGGSFDGGNNVFLDNIQNASGSAAMFGFTPVATDTIVGPVNGKPHYLFSSGVASSVVPLTLGSAAQVIDWLAYPTNAYYLDKTGSGSLAGISNVPDGMEITITFANVLTVVDTSQTGGANLRCRGAVNYTPTNTNSVTRFVARNGTLLQMTRTEQ